MITELQAQDFQKIKHLAEHCSNVEVRAVVQGMNPGRVYADHPTEPTAALIWIQGQAGFQVVGDDRSEAFLQGLDSYMRTYIEPELQKQGIHGVEIVPDHEGWGDVLRAIFDQRQLFQDFQHVFTLKGEATFAVTDQSQPRTIVRMDKETLQAGRYANGSFLEQKIHRFWDAKEDFLRQGIGYIAECGDKVASVCYSGFVEGRTHAIDIETTEEFRKNRYASQVAQAFVRECGERGIQPYWDCSPDNAGSIALAKGVGLSLEFNYPIFWYNLAREKEGS